MKRWVAWCACMCVVGCQPDTVRGAGDPETDAVTPVAPSDPHTDVAEPIGRGGTTDRDEDTLADTDALPDTDPSDDTDNTADTDLAPAVSRWTLGDPVVCTDPSTRSTTAFTAWDPAGDCADQERTANAAPQFTGGGVTVIDLDDDGVLDLLRTSAEGDFRWLTLDPTGSVDRTAELPTMPEQTSAVIPVDYDGDGDLDLHVIVWQGPDMLLRQDPDGSFVDVAAVLGMQGRYDEDTVSASWADADGDGDLDAFVAVYGPMGTTFWLPDGGPSHLFLQGPDGTFSDLVPGLPADDMLHRSHTFQGVWMEIDGDPSTPELYVVNDFGNIWPNHAYKVIGGQLVRLTGLGLEAANTCMGVAVGDVNDDGAEDIAVTTLGTIDTFVSVSGRWYRTVGIGLDPKLRNGQLVGWGAEWGDYDNDGDLDLFTGYGLLDPAVLSGNQRLEQPDGLWRNDGASFVDVAGDAGVAHLGVTRGLLAMDVNHDGWLDIVRQDLLGPATVALASCGADAWLEVELRDPHSRNTFGVGARVDVIAGTKRWTRFIRDGGRSFESAGPMEVHFGLASSDVVDRVEVLWPDGTLDTLDHVTTRRRIRLEHR